MEAYKGEHSVLFSHTRADIPNIHLVNQQTLPVSLSWNLANSHGDAVAKEVISVQH